MVARRYGFHLYIYIKIHTSVELHAVYKILLGTNLLIQSIIDPESLVQIRKYNYISINLINSLIRELIL